MYRASGRTIIGMILIVILISSFPRTTTAQDNGLNLDLDRMNLEALHGLYEALQQSDKTKLRSEAAAALARRTFDHFQYPHEQIAIWFMKAGLEYLSWNPTAAIEQFEYVIKVSSDLKPPKAALIAESQIHIGNSYLRLNKPLDAERHLQLALEMAETSLPQNSWEASAALDALGHVYADQGLIDDAISVRERSRAIYKVRYTRHGKANGLGFNTGYSSVLQNLAGTLMQRQRFADAVPNLREAQRLILEHASKSHGYYIDATARLASALTALGHFREARQLALEVRQLHLSESKERPHAGLAEIAIVDCLSGDSSAFFNSFSEYETARNSLADVRSRFDSHDFIKAYCFASFGRLEPALEAAASGVKQFNASVSANNKDFDVIVRPLGFFGVQLSYHQLLSAVAWRARPVDEQWAEASFIASGIDRADAVSKALELVAARGSEVDNNGGVERITQNASEERQRLSQRLASLQSQGLGAPGDRREAKRIADSLETLNAKLAELERNARAAKLDPSEILNRPSSVEEVKKFLKDDDILISFSLSPAFAGLTEGLFVWSVTKRRTRWNFIEIQHDQLASHVQQFRCGLDASSWLSSELCRQAYPSHSGNKSTEAPQILPFDARLAHKLFRILFTSVSELTERAHLIVIPDGPLTSLPLAALVTREAQDDLLTTSAGFRNTTWLGHTNAISILPSLTAFNMLQKMSVLKINQWSIDYMGIGNPLLSGSPQSSKQKRLATLAKRRVDCTSFDLAKAVRAGEGDEVGVGPISKPITRGGETNMQALASLAPLPDTADEICAASKIFPADRARTLLASNATERHLRQFDAQGDLAKVRILHFATHGLLFDEAAQLTTSASEPALVLTPDAGGLDGAEGLLKASEIAQLRLNAQLVILSACNTAGGTKSIRTSLSGLARAFFFAKAHALLVTQWHVDSVAARLLVGRIFESINSSQMRGLAMSKKYAMKWLATESEPIAAHPRYWAGFMFVGNGG